MTSPAMLHGASAAGAKGSVAAVREEVADVRVVLEEVVDLDQIVRRQARGRRLTRLRVLFVLLVEELRGERGVHLRAADVHAGRDEQRDDLPIGPLLHIVLTVGAGEPVAPLAAVR